VIAAESPDCGWSEAEAHNRTCSEKHGPELAEGHAQIKKLIDCVSNLRLLMAKDEIRKSCKLKYFVTFENKFDSF